MCDSNQISAIQKLISTLFSHTKSKNSTCRVLAAQCLEQAVLLAKTDRCLSDTRDITDKIMSAMINAVNDSASDARYFGRRIVNHLAENEAFERRCKQYLNGEDIKRVNAIKAEGLQSLHSKSITKLKVRFTRPQPIHCNPRLPDRHSVKTRRKSPSLIGAIKLCPGSRKS